MQAVASMMPAAPMDGASTVFIQALMPKFRTAMAAIQP